MVKIADNFNGYLNIDDDVFAYYLSNHIVTLLPAQSEPSKRYEIVDRICSRNVNYPEYLLGEDNNSKIAMLYNNKFSVSKLGLDCSVKFVAPIIIKACGNTSDFFNGLTLDWDEFHVITFYGGNINAIYNPQVAVKIPRLDEYLKFWENEGAREIKIRPWSDYTRTIDFEIEGEKVTLTISVGQAGEGNSKERMEAYSLGELNSFIRFSFENAQTFDKIERYYKIVKSLIAILTTQNNVSFEVYLSQKNSDNQNINTAVCKILDYYENYSTRKCCNVISIYDILSYVPNLIDRIVKDEIEPLLVLLPEDNRRTNKISITNVQDMCTALEVAYHWDKRSKERDKLIGELKKDIKEVISKFVKNHNEIDVYNETTISSSFQYLDYTLKQKILKIYDENSDIINEIISKRSLPKINEDNVTSFVKLRNNKTHSGMIEWGDSAELYVALLALLYTCLFKYIGVSDEIIKSILLRVF